MNTWLTGLLPFALSRCVKVAFLTLFNLKDKLHKFCSEVILHTSSSIAQESTEKQLSVSYDEDEETFVTKLP